MKYDLYCHEYNGFIYVHTEHDEDNEILKVDLDGADTEHADDIVYYNLPSEYTRFNTNLHWEC